MKLILQTIPNPNHLNTAIVYLSLQLLKASNFFNCLVLIFFYRCILWKTCKNEFEGFYFKSGFLKNVLNKINSSQNLQKLPLQFAAVRKGSFCKFWDELIFSNTFFKKWTLVTFMQIILFPCLKKFHNPWSQNWLLITVVSKKYTIAV